MLEPAGFLCRRVDLADGVHLRRLRQLFVRTHAAAKTTRVGIGMEGDNYQSGKDEERCDLGAEMVQTLQIYGAHLSFVWPKMLESYMVDVRTPAKLSWFAFHLRRNEHVDPSTNKYRTTLNNKLRSYTSVRKTIL